ncbi:hypothetical protein TpMuguga_01g00742 [Theileria parva strain Muguga]|uniref:uncharacterized protein n=1 Tax=Theileria parva strain Muguga TaxID=333668 RepID=UPI001C618B9B|nr:uncharacterized protein TpMuguga_01g00742 [Theileria parva strain Muguga]EAN33980.2 hypothetical protein TpMuguga_01g00742 [Theileria parva strain Muguga]
MSHLIFNIDINILKYVKTIKISFIANDFLRRLGFGEIPTVATSACISSQIPLNPIVSENSVIGAFLDSLNTLFWKGKHFKGKFIPSKWKWYHRHGYWATRKKKLKFDTYRRHRYHEVRGPGPRPPSKWEDQSFFKPLRQSVKFW